MVKRKSVSLLFSHTTYIPIYRKDAVLRSLFISGNYSTCSQVTVPVWQVTDSVDTVVYALDDGWRYNPKHVDQFPDINNIRNVVSFWIYFGI